MGPRKPATIEAIQAVGLNHKIELSASSDAPLLTLVHGRAGNVDLMWLFRRCAPAGWNIVSLEAAQTDPIGGFSWWPVGQENSNPQEALHAWEGVERGMLAVCEHYSLDPQSLYALGFSQGAGLLSVGIRLQPELFAGVGILAGFVARKVKLPEPVVAPGACRIYWAHGVNDKVIPVERARGDFRYLEELGYQGRMVEDDVSHKVGSEGMRGLREWFQEA